MQQVDTLEDRIGITLFNRTNHGMNLTSAGKAFYSETIKVKKLSIKAIQNVQKIAGRDSNTIKIGTSVLRNCKPLLDIWSQIDDGSYPFRSSWSHLMTRLPNWTKYSHLLEMILT